MSNETKKKDISGYSKEEWIIAGIIAVIGIPLLIWNNSSDNDIPTTKPASTASTQAPVPTWQPPAAQAPEAQPKEKYMAKVASEYEYLKIFDVSKRKVSVGSVLRGAEQFSKWVEIVDASDNYSLSLEEKETLDKFKKKIISVQVAAFPKLRDAYGPAVREKLWEDDMSARTIGAGYRIIEFVGGTFAANRNKKAWQTEVREVLYKLRFTQSRYKWYKGDNEYTYYDMEPPKDNQLVVWTGGTRFRVVE